MKTMLQVPKNYSSQECVINFDSFKTKTANLDEFINQMKVIITEDKWSTWGRTYIELSPLILKEFGITSNTPLVAYINYIGGRSHFYCYSGEIFSGDAAWFDSYREVEPSIIKNTESYNRLKKALEDKSINFLDHFNSQARKWTIVPVHNVELAIIAQARNTHIV